MRSVRQQKLFPFFAPTFFVFILSFSLPALAADGFNSSAGTDLPLGAGGAAPTMVIKNGTGNVGIKNNDPQAALDVGGGVRVGNENLCNAQKTGTLRYNSDKLQICDAASLQWKEVGGAPEYYYTVSSYTHNSTQVLSCGTMSRMTYGSIRLGCMDTGGFQGCRYYNYAVCSSVPAPAYYTIELITNGSIPGCNNGYTSIGSSLHFAGYIHSDCYVHVGQYKGFRLCKKN